jgi:hypothetical protein
MDYASIIPLDFSNPLSFVALGAFVVFVLVHCCEWLDKFRYYDSVGLYNYLKGARSGIVGTCWICMQPISYAELNPDKPRCSRSLHNHCYEAKFHRINTKCQVCGCDISHKTHLQRGNGWREIENHLCESDRCKANWAFMHAAVHGLVPTNVAHIPQHDVQEGFPQAQTMPVEYDDPDVMEAEIINHSSTEIPELDPYKLDHPIRRNARYVAPRIEHFIKQLPEPEPQQTILKFNIPDFDPVPVSRGSRTRDDGVILVDLLRRKGK